MTTPSAFGFLQQALEPESEPEPEPELVPGPGPGLGELEPKHKFDKQTTQPTVVATVYSSPTSSSTLKKVL